jgi:pyruvate/2-oxoglutarate dehydrogenase complex dihydrolipoamide acyltransferase (E2) component
MPKFTRFRDVGLWRAIAAASWRAPNDPSVYGRLEIDFTDGLGFLEKTNASSPVPITVTHVVAKAMALVLKKFPEINSVIRRQRFYLRDGVDIFAQVAIPTDAEGRKPDLSGAKIIGCDAKSLSEIARDLASKSERIRSRKDPQFQATFGMLKWIPRSILSFVIRFLCFLTYEVGFSAPKLGLPEDPFGSAMVTSVGSLGAPAAFVPFFPLGRVPLIICVGQVRPRPWVVDGQVVARPVLDLVVTFDHRYMDGLTAVRMEEYFLEILKEPGRFMT